MAIASIITNLSTEILRPQTLTSVRSKFNMFHLQLDALSIGKVSFSYTAVIPIARSNNGYWKVAAGWVSVVKNLLYMQKVLLSFLRHLQSKVLHSGDVKDHYLRPPENCYNQRRQY